MMKRYARIVFCLLLIVSVIWMPAMTHDAAINRLAQKEATALSSLLDNGLLNDAFHSKRVLETFELAQLLPDGQTSSVAYTQAPAEQEVSGAYARVQAKPYFLSLAALINLALLRLCLWVWGLLLLLPVIGALLVDALVMREVRFTRFKADRTVLYRASLNAFEACLGITVLIIVTPFAWHHAWILLSLSASALTLSSALRHFNRR